MFELDQDFKTVFDKIMNFDDRHPANLAEIVDRAAAIKGYTQDTLLLAAHSFGRAATIQHSRETMNAWAISIGAKSLEKSDGLSEGHPSFDKVQAQGYIVMAFLRGTYIVPFVEAARLSIFSRGADGQEKNADLFASRANFIMERRADVTPAEIIESVKQEIPKRYWGTIPAQIETAFELTP